jgi:hypothetical protein
MHQNAFEPVLSEQMPISVSAMPGFHRFCQKTSRA